MNYIEAKNIIKSILNESNDALNFEMDRLENEYNNDKDKCTNIDNDIKRVKCKKQTIENYITKLKGLSRSLKLDNKDKNILYTKILSLINMKSDIKHNLNNEKKFNKSLHSATRMKLTDYNNEYKEPYSYENPTNAR